MTWRLRKRRCDGRSRKLREHRVEADHDLPLGVVRPEASRIGDVTDVIAGSRLGHVLGLERPADQAFESFDRLEEGDTVRSAAAEVVDRRHRWAGYEGGNRAADVLRVQVVANLLSLVTEDLVEALFTDRACEIGEEAV